MAKVVLNVPTLWADHHVLKVRDALLGLNGVEEVFASSAWKQVLVTLDEGKTNRAALETALAEAGYPVGDVSQPIMTQPTKNRKDPAWKESVRVTETNIADREMSGDFRRY